MAGRPKTRAKIEKAIKKGNIPSNEDIIAESKKLLMETIRRFAPLVDELGPAALLDCGEKLSRIIDRVRCWGGEVNMEKINVMIPGLTIEDDQE